jgi:hypothetical protein
MEPNVNQPEPNTAPATEGAPVIGETTPPEATPQPNINTNPVLKNGEQSTGGKDKKKIAVIIFLILVLLAIAAVIGYYAYSTMNQGNSNEIPQATISQTPSPTVEPTTIPNPIQNEEELNQVINEIDNATDEASMNKEVQGLQTDSNF